MSVLSCAIKISTNKIINIIKGSSLNQNHPDVISSGKKKINLPCVDIAGLINKYNDDDVIVVKIDIEGAEFDLIIDFIKKNTLKLIDYIAVEYHPTVSPFSTTEDVFNKIIEENGIKFAKWN